MHTGKVGREGRQLTITPNDDRLHELLAKALDRRISDAEQDELERLLLDRPEARQAYLDMVVLEPYLELEYRSQEDLRASPAGEGRASRAFRHVARFFVRPTPLSVTVATLVIGVLLTAMAFSFVPAYQRWRGSEVAQPALPQSGAVAQISGAHNAVWSVDANQDTQRQDGAVLNSGDTLALDAGFAQITYDNQSQIILEGPCEFQISSASSGELHRGRLTAHVGPTAAGFTISTPKVVDLGTEFGIQVDDNDRTDVLVFSGVVDVALRNSGRTSSTKRLTEGDAVQVARGRIVSTSEATPNAPQPTQFARILPVPLVESATGDTGFPVMVVANGLQDGALAYSDEKHEWGNLSPQLHGLTYVRTPNANRYEKTYSVELTLARPARVYVLSNQRRERTPWLKNDVRYRLTEMTAELVTSYPKRANRLVPFSVWFRDVERPGAVTLGPEAGNGGGVFGIVIAPLQKQD